MPLDADKHARSVPLMCPTCGGTSMRADDGTGSEAPFRCADCGVELSKDELISANRENLSIHARELAEEAIPDLAQDLRDMLKKTFSGSKHIRIK